MATPQMQVQNVSGTVRNASPTTIRVLTKNPDGTPLDVHTGYTVNDFKAVPQSGFNPGFSPVSLASACTPAFDTTGVSLNFTQAQATALQALLPSTTSSAYLYLSNDAGTTQTLAALMIISLDTVSQEV